MRSENGRGTVGYSNFSYNGFNNLISDNSTFAITHFVQGLFHINFYFKLIYLTLGIN